MTSCAEIWGQGTGSDALIDLESASGAIIGSVDRNDPQKIDRLGRHFPR
jgi:hypothetical protein